MHGEPWLLIVLDEIRSFRLEHVAVGRFALLYWLQLHLTSSSVP